MKVTADVAWSEFRSVDHTSLPFFLHSYQISFSGWLLSIGCRRPSPDGLSRVFLEAQDITVVVAGGRSVASVGRGPAHRGRATCADRDRSHWILKEANLWLGLSRMCVTERQYDILKFLKWRSYKP